MNTPHRQRKRNPVEVEAWLRERYPEVVEAIEAPLRRALYAELDRKVAAATEVHHCAGCDGHDMDPVNPLFLR